MPRKPVLEDRANTTIELLLAFYQIIHLGQRFADRLFDNDVAGGLQRICRSYIMEMVWQAYIDNVNWTVIIRFDDGIKVW